MAFFIFEDFAFLFFGLGNPDESLAILFDQISSFDSPRNTFVTNPRELASLVLKGLSGCTSLATLYRMER